MRGQDICKISKVHVQIKYLRFKSLLPFLNGPQKTGTSHKLYTNYKLYCSDQNNLPNFIHIYI